MVSGLPLPHSILQCTYKMNVYHVIIILPSLLAHLFKDKEFQSRFEVSKTEFITSSLCGCGGLELHPRPVSVSSWARWKQQLLVSIGLRWKGQWGRAVPGHLYQFPPGFYVQSPMICFRSLQNNFSVVLQLLFFRPLFSQLLLWLYIISLIHSLAHYAYKGSVYQTLADTYKNW